jgi:hypothetical protein
MKKKLLSILFIFICSFGFSYGYRNTYWGESAQDMIRTSGKNDHFSWNNLLVFKEPARLLGEATTIFYTLANNKLNGICYCVTDNAATRQELEKLFNTKKLSIVTRGYFSLPDSRQEEYNLWMLEVVKQHFNCSYITIDEALAYYRGGKTLINTTTEDKADREIIIADYDADTQVFIYVGIVPNKICVGYVQKQEDF